MQPASRGHTRQKNSLSNLAAAVQAEADKLKRKAAANLATNQGQMKRQKLAVEFDLLTPQQEQVHGTIMLSTLGNAPLLPQSEREQLLGMITSLKRAMAKDYVVFYAVQKFVLQCVGGWFLPIAVINNKVMAQHQST